MSEDNNVEEVTGDDSNPEDGGVPLTSDNMEAFLEDDADDLGEGEEGSEPVAETPTETPIPEGQEKAEAAEGEATPTLEEKGAEPEVPPVGAQPQPTEPTPEPAPVQPTAEPDAAPVVQPAEPTPLEEVRANYQRNRDEMQNNLAKTHYAMSEEQVTRLDTGDASLIPEIAAKVYMDAVTGAVAHMLTSMPQLVQQVLDQSKTDDDFNGKFYAANPGLDPASHGVMIQQFGQAYRQVMPQASPEEFIRDVGAQVMVALRIPPPGQPPLAEASIAAAPPFIPAGTGSQGGGIVVPHINPFDALTKSMEEGDVETEE